MKPGQQTTEFKGAAVISALAAFGAFAAQVGWITPADADTFTKTMMAIAGGVWGIYTAGRSAVKIRNGG